MTYLFYFTRNLRKTQRVMWVYFFQVISRKFPYALRLKFCQKQPPEVLCKKRCFKKF